MRTYFIAAATAVGFGLAAISGASAAPVNGAVIGDLATSTNHATTVQHYRYGSYGGHYRYGSRGHYRYGSYGHGRYGSRGY
jgi:hypothetical protein